MEENNIYRPCPICNSSDIKNIRHISFNMENILPDYYFLANCNNCGFVYANTPASVDDYERYYNEHNKYSSTITIDNEADSIYNLVSPLLFKYVKKDDAVLDMGCGTGGLLINMQNDGYSNLTGCDPSHKSVTILKEKKLNCIKGSIYDVPVKKNYFDVIILSGVLEHIYDLKNAIKNVSLYLKPNGKIICNVPDVLNYYTCSTPLAYQVNIEHINHFSPNTLSKLFEDFKFSILECISIKIPFGAINAPVIIGVFENQKSNVISYNRINMFLNDLEAKEYENNLIIDKLVCSHENLAIWGTGNFARSKLMNTNLRNANISFFIDNNKEMVEKDFCGYNVKSPDSLKDFNGTILVFSILYHNDIEKQILNMGLKNYIIIN